MASTSDVDRLTKRLELGTRVNQLRRRRGWTTRQLAKESGVSDSYVSRLETGATAKPRYEDLELVADALGTTVFWLINGYNPVEERGDGSVPLAGDPEFRNAAFKLSETYNNASEDDKRFIKRSLEILRAQIEK